MLTGFPPLLRLNVRALLLGVAMAGPSMAEEQNPAAASATSAAGAMRVLKANCLSCHNEEKRKGGLALHSREALLTGGENGPTVVTGKPEDSALILSLAAEADPHMPPKKQLKPEQIAILRDWVRDGLAWDADALAGAVSAPRAVSLTALPAAYRPVMAMALSPDGSRLAAGCGGEVLLFGMRSVGSDGPAAAAGQDAATAAGDSMVLLARAQAQPDAVLSMAWLPDGKTLVTGAFRHAVVWKVEKDTLAAQREISSGLTDRISAIIPLSPAATPPDTPPLLALADGLAAEAGIIRILDVNSGQLVKSWTAHSDTIYATALSHDGKRLATAGGDKLVKIWNPETGAETGRIEAHSSQVLSVAFNPDDTQLITGGADRQLKIWDAATRGNLISLPIKDSAFNALKWSSAGPSVFAAMDDGGLMKYSNFKAHTGAQSSESAQENRVGKTDSALYCLTVSNDATQLFAGSHDGHIFRWDKDGKLIQTLNAVTAQTQASAPAVTASPADSTPTSAAASASPAVTP